MTGHWEFRFPDFDSEEQHRRIRILGRLRSGRPQINVILFLLTIGTTYLIYRSLLYSAAIIAILLSHEMGHYLMCRRYGIRATLPYFIPMPFPPFGTMGAVIRMEQTIPNRRALFDVGVAGPLAGLIFTIPSIIFGLKMSEIVSTTSLSSDVQTLGESLMFTMLSKLVLGSIPEGYDVLLHPLAFAGWAGLFVTALNLLPVGQLDGGHIIYAILGRKSRYVFRVALLAFIFICIFYFWGWLLMILFIIWFGYRHPPPMDDVTPLDTKRKLIGGITFLIFLTSFTPVPFKFH
ncbi:site-2 protease family protein [candidate division KSB1 bacterium]|nr:MAG: site-2 protease family protein [candidate division KSB1 bacterium]